ncbi:hypothetical protein K491DRAFT_685105 [Lophiostoma macrostomum CBS 122681]|uniref:Uncharacterized protein n=1 Tax=Lophiostoma macrostomum CBS 122681 TaxID=1314788 RepID=A0A6A6SK13_9PLEO|nr:hypothetical protein K491DRAFT_685105 [Lophiostoma macrostomum CBS 122681]
MSQESPERDACPAVSKAGQEPRPEPPTALPGTTRGWGAPSFAVTTALTEAPRQRRRRRRPHDNPVHASLRLRPPHSRPSLTMRPRIPQKQSGDATVRTQPARKPPRRQAQSTSNAADEDPPPSRNPGGRETKEDAVKRLVSNVQAYWGVGFVQQLEARSVYLPETLSRHFCETLSRLARANSLDAFAVAVARAVAAKPVAVKGQGTQRFGPEGTRSLQVKDLESAERDLSTAASNTNRTTAPSRAPKPAQPLPTDSAQTSDAAHPSKKRRRPLGSPASPEIARGQVAVHSPLEQHSDEDEVDYVTDQSQSSTTASTTRYSLSGLLLTPQAQPFALPPSRLIEDQALNRELPAAAVGLGTSGGRANPQISRKTRGRAHPPSGGAPILHAHGAFQAFAGRRQHPNTDITTPRSADAVGDHEQDACSSASDSAALRLDNALPHSGTHVHQSPALELDRNRAVEQIKESMKHVEFAFERDVAAYQAADKMIMESVAAIRSLQAPPAIPDSRNLADNDAFVAYVELLNGERVKRDRLRTQAKANVDQAERALAAAADELREWDTAILDLVAALQRLSQTADERLHRENDRVDF